MTTLIPTISTDTGLDELIKRRDQLLLKIHKLEQELSHIYTTETSTNKSAKQQIEENQVDIEVELDQRLWSVPPHCIPINADVLAFDFTQLAAECQFDVIMMDPPWQLATSSCTRGVHISYGHLTDVEIQSLPLPSLQTNGFLFLWTINNKYVKSIEMMQNWGYEFVDEIVWVKSTVNRRLAKGHGYYLQHAKESCLVGKKGNIFHEDANKGVNGCVGSDVIFAERRGQSQKPEEIYELAEMLVPNGNYLEIFGRRNNLRNYWVTIGNEL